MGTHLPGHMCMCLFFRSVLQNISMHYWGKFRPAMWYNKHESWYMRVSAVLHHVCWLVCMQCCRQAGKATAPTTTDTILNTLYIAQSGYDNKVTQIRSIQLFGSNKLGNDTHRDTEVISRWHTHDLKMTYSWSQHDTSMTSRRSHDDTTIVLSWHPHNAK